MDDATQKLVDAIENGREWMQEEEWEAAYPGDVRPGYAVIKNLVDSASAALEAAQRPPVMDEIEFRLSLIKEARAERDEARAAIENARRAPASAVDGPSMTIDAKAAIQGVLEALAHVPAAQRPPVSPEAREEMRNTLLGYNPDSLTAGGREMYRPDIEARERETDAILARFSVPSRPEVGPEVREGMRDALREAHQYDYDFDPEWDYTEDDDRYIDALLARFSVPSQPVYDEEAIARFLALVDDYDGCFERIDEWEALPDWEKQAHPDEEPMSDREDAEWWLRRARALVAALRGGELTREESDRG
jgi:hypothetical protein